MSFLSLAINSTTTTATSSMAPPPTFEAATVIVVIAGVLTALFLGPTFVREILKILIRPNLQLEHQISIEREPRFMKYPGSLPEQTGTNLAYCKIMLENLKPTGRLKRMKGKGRGTARVGITLRATNIQGQKEFPLLWLIPGNPTVAPIAPGDRLPVNFLTINPEGHEMIVPTVSRGEPGLWNGSILVPGIYDLALKSTGGEWVELGRFELPQVMLGKALPSEVARYAQEHGGYCVYFDRIEGGVRADCKGAIEDERLTKLVHDYPSAQIMRNDRERKPRTEGKVS